MERTTFEIVVQALSDFLDEAVGIFRTERDFPQDIAEDVLREAVDSMGLSTFSHRLYGKFDYKKAIYVFTPKAQRVALMLDAKAEKESDTATLQMSQTSMFVQFKSRGKLVSGQGLLQQSLSQNGGDIQVVSIVAKFEYENRGDGGYDLKRIVVACIPNSALQQSYNPSETDHIWAVGRNSPTRGEDFRVRLKFALLRDKQAWRVRELTIGYEFDFS